MDPTQNTDPAATSSVPPMSDPLATSPATPAFGTTPEPTFTAMPTPAPTPMPEPMPTAIPEMIPPMPEPIATPTPEIMQPMPEPMPISTPMPTLMPTSMDAMPVSNTTTPVSNVNGGGSKTLLVIIATFIITAFLLVGFYFVIQMLMPKTATPVAAVVPTDTANGPTESGIVSITPADTVKPFEGDMIQDNTAGGIPNYTFSYTMQIPESTTGNSATDTNGLNKVQVSGADFVFIMYPGYAPEQEAPVVYATYKSITTDNLGTVYRVALDNTTSTSYYVSDFSDRYGLNGQPCPVNGTDPLTFPCGHAAIVAPTHTDSNEFFFANCTTITIDGQAACDAIVKSLNITLK